MSRRKRDGINARAWFYGQSFVSSGYTETVQKPCMCGHGESLYGCPIHFPDKETTTAYDALERLNNAVGYLQTLPEFTAEAQNILADARKQVARANLRQQDWLRKQSKLEDKYPLG